MNFRYISGIFVRSLPLNDYNHLCWCCCCYRCIRPNKTATTTTNTWLLSIFVVQYRLCWKCLCLRYVYFWWDVTEIATLCLISCYHYLDNNLFRYIRINFVLCEGECVRVCVCAAIWSFEMVKPLSIGFIFRMFTILEHPHTIHTHAYTQ